MRRIRRGATLVELMVVLAILTLMASVTVVGLRRADAPTAPRDADRIAAARREAIARGHAVHFLLRDSLSVRLAQALPDGRVLQARTSAQDSVISEGSDATR